MASCLSDNTLVALVEGLMDESERQRISEHLDECPLCRALTAGMAISCFRSDSEPTESASFSENSGRDLNVWSPPAQFDEYRVRKFVGRGQMGEVYEGYDTALDRRVAIKFLRAHVPDANGIERFRTESRAIARLQHPHVVAVYRAGQIAGRPFLVSEFVQGRSLEKIPLPLPWQQVLFFASQLAAAVGAAHRQGILHRDIKPANVMLTDGGEVKLLDFGLAKLRMTEEEARTSPLDGLNLEQESHSLTASGAMVGTPRYMAPELWQGMQATARSDVYSLGAMLYELACAEPPFTESPLRSLIAATRVRDETPLSKRVPDIAPELSAIIHRCLSKAPGERFSDGEDLAKAIDSCIRSRTRQRMTLRQGLMAGIVAVSLFLIVVSLLSYQKVAKKIRGMRQAALARSAVVPRGMKVIPGGRFIRGSTDEEIQSSAIFCRTMLSQSNAEDREKACKTFHREGPSFEVEVSTFFIDQYEVTNQEFAQWLNSLSPLSFRWARLVSTEGTLLADLQSPESGLVIDPLVSMKNDQPSGLAFRSRAGAERNPVSLVTWDAADRYCRSYGKRLPTETEWEYVARGTERRPFPWGGDPPTCSGSVLARAPEWECRRFPSAPMPVGAVSQDVTPLGVHDMAGNVMEWVGDWFLAEYPVCSQPCIDPVVRTISEANKKELRAVRGSSYNEPGPFGFGVRRSRWEPSDPRPNLGFRCARSVP